MKQGFLLLLCISTITIAPSCRNKKNEGKSPKTNTPIKDTDKSVKKTKEEATQNYSS